MGFGGPKWYDMEGNELHDMEAVEALLCDIAARRVALTDFDGRAEVSTVLLVLDHNWNHAKRTCRRGVVGPGRSRRSHAGLLPFLPPQSTHPLL